MYSFRSNQSGSSLSRKDKCNADICSLRGLWWLCDLDALHVVLKPRSPISSRSKCSNKHPHNTWHGRVLEVCSIAGKCTCPRILDHDFADLFVPKTVHVNCLYNIHKRNPPALDNEPRYTDVRGLTGFKIEALYARVSILAFLGILKKGSSSFADPGQETTDLGIQQTAGEPKDPISAPVGDELDGKVSSNTLNRLGN